MSCETAVRERETERERERERERETERKREREWERENVKCGRSLKCSVIHRYIQWFMLRPSIPIWWITNMPPYSESELLKLENAESKYWITITQKDIKLGKDRTNLHWTNCNGLSYLYPKGELHYWHLHYLQLLWHPLIPLMLSTG